MSAQNIELLKRMNGLVNAGDWDALLALHHPDVEYTDLQNAPDLPQVVRGREDLRAMIVQWFDTVGELKAEGLEYFDEDPWVLARARWSGRSRGSDIDIDVSMVNAYEIADGLVVRAVMGYRDLDSALRSVRSSP